MKELTPHIIIIIEAFSQLFCGQLHEFSFSIPVYPGLFSKNSRRVATEVLHKLSTYQTQPSFIQAQDQQLQQLTGYLMFKIVKGTIEHQQLLSNIVS